MDLQLEGRRALVTGAGEKTQGDVIERAASVWDALSAAIGADGLVARVLGGRNDELAQAPCARQSGLHMAEHGLTGQLAQDFAG